MGYSTVSTSIFSPDMKQTPENIAKVLDLAGWTVADAAAEVRTDPLALRNAKMPQKVWQELLNKAGRRSFDHDEGAA